MSRPWPEHPYEIGDRVEFGGKRGTVREVDWGSQAGKLAPFVTVGLDDQGDRRPNEPERRYRWHVSLVTLVSAIEQLGDLAK